MKKIVCLFLILFSMVFCDALVRNTQTLVTPSISSYIDSSGVDSHTFYITTTGISTNVIFKLEGSADGSLWANLDDTLNNSTITSNTTVMYHKDHFSTGLMRLNWISKSGIGTTPNLKIDYVGRKGK